MSKEAQTEFKIHNLLTKRWSPRAFEDRDVEKDKILRMMEAARWSPSSSNQQPWSFIIGEKGKESYDKIFNCLIEFNQQWAKFAPLLILSVGQHNMISKENENRYFKYDVGQAVAHMTFQATQDGLYVHQMAGFDKKKARMAFGIPEDYDALSVIAVGYIGRPEILHPRMQKSEIATRERKSLKEFVFTGKFGKTSNLLDHEK